MSNPRTPAGFLTAAAFLVAACQPPAEQAPAADASASAPTEQVPVRAVATVMPITEVPVGGEFTLESVGDFVRIQGTVTGLPDGKHGFHIHEGSTCQERGGHFNPAGAPHGSPDQPAAQRHVGDLGNLVSEGDTARYERVDHVVRLEGADAIVGRVFVIHQGEDQFLPQPSGDAGTQIGCGVIERVDAGM